MATKTQPPKSEAKPTAHADEYRGAFGFFRKYQKLILYSAGLFALISFSITGALLGLFDAIFAQDRSMPTIEVAGKTVNLQVEDYQKAGQIAKGSYWPAVVLPGFDPGDRDDATDALALMRRAAIAEGMEVSDDEVDRAIAYALANLPADSNVGSATELALRNRLSSLEEYRQVIKEAMRIGNFMRLQSLAADTSDPVLVQQLLKDREKITVSAAQLDVKAIEDKMKEGELDDAELRTYLDELPDNEKERFKDTNHVKLEVAALRFDDFDPAAWQEEVLKDIELGEEQLKLVYETEKERLFKVDPEEWEAQGNPLPAPEHKAFEADDVKARCTKLLQADEVMNHLWSVVEGKRNEVLQPLLDSVLEAQTAQREAQTAQAEAQQKVDTDPENNELKQALEAADAELAARTERVTADEKAAQEAREAFEAGPAFLEAVGDKQGFSVFAFPEEGPANAEALKQLGELGEWKNPFSATFVRNNGEISSRVDRTETGAFHFKVTELVERPMKPFEDIKDDLRDAFFGKKAQEQADEKKKALEDALLRLAKEKIPEKVQELEGQKETKVQEQLGEWEQGLKDKIADAEEKLGIATPGTEAHKAWQDQRDGLAAQLEKKEEQQTSITETVGTEVDDEIAEAAKEHFHEVLEAAAAEAGFEMVKIGPHDRNLSRTPRFGFRFEEPDKFLMSNPTVNQLEVDAVTDVLDDRTNLRLYVARCDAEEPMTLADLTRREFQQARDNFASSRVSQALGQSFSLTALKQRYRFEDNEREPETAGPN